ncbi:hypothetical protein P9X10_02205 [Bacillus cereus]|nr:hypothetical protein [Bacillus cereus]
MEKKANVLRLEVIEVAEGTNLKWSVVSLPLNEEGFIEHETLEKEINGGEFVGGIYALENSSMYFNEEGINNFNTYFAIKTPYEYLKKIYGVGLFVGHDVDENPIGLTEEEMKEMRERCEIQGYGLKHK